MPVPGPVLLVNAQEEDVDVRAVGQNRPRGGGAQSGLQEGPGRVLGPVLLADSHEENADVVQNRGNKTIVYTIDSVYVSG